MNNTEQAWDDEYDDPKLLTKSDEPTQEFLRFIRFLRKDREYNLEGKTILDLGCGTGRNILYCVSQYGAHGFGYDISEEALGAARQQAVMKGIHDVVFEKRSIGDSYPLPDNSIDLIFDMTASHALTAAERNVYLQEVARTLKTDGYFLVRILCRDGDRNAQNLIKMFPGSEYDTYIHPELHITERVFREEDFRELYGLYFDIIELKKHTGYQRWEKQSYKRRYLVAYLRKKQ